MTNEVQVDLAVFLLLLAPPERRSVTSRALFLFLGGALGFKGHRVTILIRLERDFFTFFLLYLFLPSRQRRQTRQVCTFFTIHE